MEEDTFQGEPDLSEEVGALTQDSLERMKRSGMKKPDNVTWSQWLGPQKINSKHNLVCHMAAIGLRNRDIARQTGLSETRVSTLINNPKVRNEIKHLQSQMFAEDPKKRFSALMDRAADVIEEIMNNEGEKGSTRLMAASLIKETVMGKASQHIDIGSNLIRELFDRMDKKKEMIDVTVTGAPKEDEITPLLLESPESEENDSIVETVAPKPDSEVDDWLEKNLGEK